MKYTIEEIRAKAAQWHDGSNGFANANRLNAYECDGETSFRKGVPDKPGCGHYIVTIDREPGVTPFIVRCGNCGMSARSKGYKVQSHLTPTHEWYRPESLNNLTPWESQHVHQGGLLLRPIGDAQWCSPDHHERDRMHSMKKALDDRFHEARKVEATNKLNALSRQAQRHEKRKSQTPPDTVTMYGRTYRLVE